MTNQEQPKWDFDRFASLSEDEQRQVIKNRFLDDGELWPSLTDSDEFSSAQTETNGAMFEIDDYDVESVTIDKQLREVRADLSYSASAWEEASDLGGSLPIAGTAVLVIEDHGESSLEEIQAEAVYDESDDDDDDENVELPTSTRIRLEALPKRAQIACAVRCAWRVEPLVNRAGDLHSINRFAIHRAIALGAAVADASLGMVAVSSIEDTVEITRSVAEFVRTVDSCAGSAAYAAVHVSAAVSDVVAAVTKQRGSVASECWEVLKNVSQCRTSEHDLVIALMERDLAKLTYIIENESTQSTASSDELGPPIDLSESGPLGPLWPNGAPSWFTELETVKDLTPEDLSTQEYMSKPDDWISVSERMAHYRRLQGLKFTAANKNRHLPLTVYVDPGRANARLLSEIFLALSAVYEAQGGSGLKIVNHQIGILDGVPV